MTEDKAYFVGVHKFSHKSGVPAEILGIIWVTPDGLEPRLCYHIQWADRCEDWVPISDTANYKVISFSDILAGKIPVITY